MFEGNARGRMQIQVGLEGLAQQGARLQRADAIARLESRMRAAQQSIHEVQTRQLRRLEIELGIPKEKSRLARRLTAMSEHGRGIVIQHVTAVQLADSIIAQARPLTDGMGARFVANQTQREIQALAVPRVAVIGHSHGGLPWQFVWFGVKKNLTEINHKVSVIAKWIPRVNLDIPKETVMQDA